MSRVRQSIIDLERMLGLIEESPDITDKDNAPALRLSKGAIRFEDVHFLIQIDLFSRGVF